MTKKLVAFMLLVLTVFTTQAQTYHEQDVEGLRKFLGQPRDGASAICNDLHITTDMLYNSLSWIKEGDIYVYRPGNTSNYLKLGWSNTVPKRLISLDIKVFAWEMETLSLDCNYFPELKKLDYPIFTKMTDFKIDKCTKLESLYYYRHSNSEWEVDHTLYPELKVLEANDDKSSSIDLSKNTKLAELVYRGAFLTEMKLANSADLKKIYLNTSLSTDMGLSNYPNLDYLYFVSHNVKDIDLTNCNKLKYVEIQAKALENIKFTSCPDLIEMRVWGADLLKDIDLKPLKSLKYLRITASSIPLIDLSENKNLVFLLIGTKDKVDLSNNTNLESLNIYYLDHPIITDLRMLNKLDRLEMTFTSANSILLPDRKIQNVNIRLNQFKLSDLAKNVYQTENDNWSYVGYYYEQNVIEGGEVEYSNIDLSAEYKFGDNITNYKWYDEDENEISLANLGNGKFAASKEYIGRKLTCVMTNATFPRMGTYRTYFNGQLVDKITPGSFIEFKLTAPKHPTLQSNMLYRKSSTGQRLYSVNTGESFNVMVDSSNPDANIRVGLFEKNTGTFIEDITASVSGKTYTCNISDDVSSGSFIVAPYIETEGTKQLVSRPKGSHIIDRISLTVVNEWSEWLRSATASTDLTANMQIKTATNDLMEVSTNTQFKVLARYLATSSDIKIGLFNTNNGSLVKNITVSFANGTYTCLATDDILSGNYILAPYEMVDDKVVFIERPEAKNFYIDRFMLYVSNDIWTRSASLNNEPSASVGLYPNPVSDVLHINSDSQIQTIELFDMTGRLVRKAENTSSVAVKDLSNGMYVVKVVTDKDVSTYKVNKK